MAERRYFWKMEENPFDVIRMPEFTLLEGVFIICALVALALYLVLISSLDTFSKYRSRRAKQLRWLDRWLAHAALDPAEETELDALVGSKAPLARHALLSNVASLEARLHQALSEALGISAHFAEKLRNSLNYTSRNLHVPVVSTRQLLPGDAVRMSYLLQGVSRHHYGKVVSTDLNIFTVEFADQASRKALQTAEEAGTELRLFYLRELGLEYPFSGISLLPFEQGPRLMLRHTLAKVEQNSRPTRLPVMLEVTFNPIDLLADNDGLDDPDFLRGGAKQQPGTLIDLSSNGFCLSHQHPLQAGQYIQLHLPRQRPARPLLLTGYVLECHSFAPEQNPAQHHPPQLSRCKLRGLDSSQRKLLSHILRQAQSKRLQLLKPITRSTTSPVHSS